MESFPGEAVANTPSLAEDPALGLSQRAKMEILFAVMLGLFLGALDQTIVGPALPTIVTQLAGNDVAYLLWQLLAEGEPRATRHPGTRRVPPWWWKLPTRASTWTAG